MSSLRNKVQLIGRLGNDPELQTFDSGKKMVKFSIATDDFYRNAEGERVKQTDWHNVVAWSKTAEIISNHVKKGQEIALEGKLTTRSWEGEDGKKRYTTEVICDEVVLLGSKQ